MNNDVIKIVSLQYRKRKSLYHSPAVHRLAYKLNVARCRVVQALVLLEIYAGVQWYPRLFLEGRESDVDQFCDTIGLVDALEQVGAVERREDGAFVIVDFKEVLHAA